MEELSALGASRPDPRTALLVVLVINTLVMSRVQLPFTLLCSAVGICALVVARAYRGARVAIGLNVAWFLVSFLPGQLWHNGLTALLSVAGVWTLAFIVAGTIAGYALAVISLSELIAALRALRIPVAITVALTVTIRFIPTVVKEYRGVRDAMSLRGLGKGASVLIHPLRYLEFVLVPLLMSCTRIGDQMTAAGMVKGLGSPVRPTLLRTLLFRWSDALWFVILGAIVALYVWLPHNGLLGGMV